MEHYNNEIGFIRQLIKWQQVKIQLKGALKTFQEIGSIVGAGAKSSKVTVLRDVMSLEQTCKGDTW